MAEVTLENCDREPIHIPGRVQSHGVLLVADRHTLQIVQVSQNVKEVLGLEPDAVLESNLITLVPQATHAKLEQFLREPFPEQVPLSVFSFKHPVSGAAYDCLAHKQNDLFIIEVEPAGNPNEAINQLSLLRAAIAEARRAHDIGEFCEISARYFRRFTGYDRVMIYRFQEDSSGEVVGESKRDDLESFLGLHYPATDIPAQARRLYALNPVRIIADVNDPTVPLTPNVNPITRAPLDMSFSTLRAVSPIHIEYLQNMGVGASMSVSLLDGDKLIGLIACHHYSPRFLPFNVRTACEYFAHAFALQFRNKLDRATLDQVRRAKRIAHDMTLALQADQPVHRTLQAESEQLLSMVNAQGVAFKVGNHLICRGETPAGAAVKRFVAWLRQQKVRGMWHTASIRESYPDYADMEDHASGLLAVPLQDNWQSYIIWFRGEEARTVNWAGKPDEKEIKELGDGRARLSPRRSFAVWRETVRHRSSAWQPHELDNAEQFTLTQLALRVENERRRKAEDRYRRAVDQLKRSNHDLQQFAYVASHDLQEPLRAVAGCLRLLERRFNDKLDGPAAELLQHAVDGSIRMQRLIEGLLAYSRINSRGRPFAEVEMEGVLEEARHNLMVSIEENQAEVTCDRLPAVSGDRLQLVQLFQNIMGNALKFRSEDAPKIHVSARQNGDFHHFYIADNGIGVEPEYAERIFDMFKRLHSRQEYQGTGIGLAICKKIVQRHGGIIECEPVEPKGCRFHFTLPRADLSLSPSVEE
ncbi:MAG: multi-sensor signal transduction histidine kinase [Puniceicoccaceae bacterium 5H]|nr:MAG: multi-sensor signal transduction histidine kinase [Puniceicoccaceae bacterium 5H]